MLPPHDIMAQNTQAAGLPADSPRTVDSSNDSDTTAGCTQNTTYDSDTLTSSITSYKMENNRRYHAYKDGSYWGPNDEAANEGQDLAHGMYALTLDGALHLAPIHPAGQILDVGTGMDPLPI